MASKRTERKALVANIVKFADSMSSHLEWCIERNPAGKDTRKFHVDTVIEYLQDMLKAAKALR